MMQKGFNKLIISPMCYLMKISKAVSEKKTFKDYQILYMFIAQGPGQITQEKFLIVTKRVCYFDHTL